MFLLMCATLYAAPARLSFGDASASGDHFTIPIYAEGNVARLEAMALRVNYPRGAIVSATMHRAGLTAGPKPMFETAVEGPDSIVLLASFSQPVAESADLGRSVIAEVELTFAPSAPRDLQITLDPALCTLGEKSGMNMFSVANGTLVVTGTSIDRAAGRNRAARH